MFPYSLSRNQTESFYLQPLQDNLGDTAKTAQGTIASIKENVERVITLVWRFWSGTKYRPTKSNPDFYPTDIRNL